MKLKERIEHIMENSVEFLHDHGDTAEFNYQIWADKPNVAVALWPVNVDAFGIAEPTFGFSKVRYPDVWNEEFGINLALYKAAKKLARKTEFEAFRRAEIDLLNPEDMGLQFTIDVLEL